MTIPTIKVVFNGPTEAGKTSLLIRLYETGNKLDGFLIGDKKITVKTSQEYERLINYRKNNQNDSRTVALHNYPMTLVYDGKDFLTIVFTDTPGASLQTPAGLAVMANAIQSITITVLACDEIYTIIYSQPPPGAHIVDLENRIAYSKRMMETIPQIRTQSEEYDKDRAITVLSKSDKVLDPNINRLPDIAKWTKDNKLTSGVNVFSSSNSSYPQLLSKTIMYFIVYQAVISKKWPVKLKWKIPAIESFCRKKIEKSQEKWTEILDSEG